MSQDDQNGQDLTQAFYRGLTQPRLTRQGFMRGAGAAIMAALAPQISRAATVTDWQSWWANQKPTDEFVFAVFDFAPFGHFPPEDAFDGADADGSDGGQGGAQGEEGGEAHHL